MKILFVSAQIRPIRVIRVPFFFLHFSFFIFHFSFSQPNIDSLQNLLQNSKEDTNKVNLLNAISREFLLNDDFENVLKYGNDALILSEKINYPKGIAYAKYNLGSIFMHQGQNEKAIQNFTSANEIFSSLSITDYSGRALSKIAEIYDRSSVYDKAIDFYFQSLKKYNEVNFIPGTLFNLDRLGNIYSELRNYSKAIEMYEQCLSIDEKAKDEVGISIDYNNLGNAFKNKGDLNKGFEYHQKSPDIRKKLGMNLEIGESLGNIANIFLEQGKDFRFKILK